MNAPTWFNTLRRHNFLENPMTTALSILFCSLFGAVTTHSVYVRSNLYIHGDPIRRGRHNLFDPLAFDLLGFLWGIVVGAVCGAIWSTANPVKVVGLSLAITVFGIGVVGGVSTYRRYLELPRSPKLPGPALQLQFEVRCPSDRDAKSPLPTRGALNPASKQGSLVKLLTSDVQVSDRRVILPGHVPLRYAESSRLITFQYEDGTEATFTLPLAEVPTDADRDWSNWMNAVNAATGLPATQVFQIRYRVRLASER